MRKLVFILLAFIAALTFIRAYDNSGTQDFTQAAIPIETK
jgi:hypothetical protein